MDIENRAKKNSVENPVSELEKILREVLRIDNAGSTPAEIDENILNDIKAKYNQIIREMAYSKIINSEKVIESMVDVIKEKKCVKGYGEHVEINEFGGYCAKNHSKKPSNGNEDEICKDSIYLGVYLNSKGLAEIMMDKGKEYIIFIPVKK